jgi:maltooligosyltrehalose trehalohydrolase
MPRGYSIGAEPLPGGGVGFRVWAPKCKRVEVVLDSGDSIGMERCAGGYFAGVASDAGHGTRYRYCLDGGDSFPDPASRFQPEGPHGSSQVVDATRFHWTDAAWGGAGIHGQVVYELHTGTFTREGTWDAARRELSELAAIGITLIELMPVSEFSGKFGWGYDGVAWFAPFHHYGEPDDLRRFVDHAHRLGLGVVLDVVYNHLGPDGNYLKQFSDAYFTDRYKNDWGEALNFDGPDSAPVRDFVCANAAYWADEFHLDGLRLDATQQIFDASPENIMAALAKAFRASAGVRKTFIVGENEPQHSRLARPVEQGGYGLDGLWNDDFHHAVRVAATGHNEAYYSDYRGSPQELISALKYGYLFQGQRYEWQGKTRGTPAWGMHPAQFVTYIENHDQMANSAHGARLHQLANPGRYRALTALLLLAPGTPMLFQGQEFAASSPFLFFADFDSQLRKSVAAGRRQFLSQFPSFADPEVSLKLPDPADPSIFKRCKLDFLERHTHEPLYRLHKDLLRLRKEDPAFHAPQPRGLDGAVLSADAFVLRFFEGPGGTSRHDRLLLVNLGRDLILNPASDPLLAPPEDMRWSLHWSSEDPRYGGSGTVPFNESAPWRVPGEAAVAMIPCPK